MINIKRHYYFSISGVKLDIEVDKEVLMTKAFLPFKKEDVDSDFSVHIETVDELPTMSEYALYNGEFYKVHRNEKGEYIKLFFESSGIKKPYAISSYNVDTNSLSVKYLKKGERNFSNFQNTFLHLSFEEILMHHKRLCVHASCVDSSLGGILFSGPSGIGKSTQAENWCKYRGAKQINGDRPIITKDEMGWKAWGSPYAGSSRCYKNSSCLIRAIVVLKQTENCKLRRMSEIDAFKAIWSGVTAHSWDRKYMEMACDMTMELTQNIPVFEFCCTPDECAVDFLESELRKEVL